MSFGMSKNYKNAGLPMVRCQMEQIVFSRVNGIVETGFGHVFITLSTFYFFYKTDFEQHLFKATIRTDNLKKIHFYN